MPTGIRWDAATQRYRRANGTFVARGEVRAALDAVILKAENRVRALSQALASSAVNVEDWAAAMRAEVKRQHLVAGAAARGGWANLTASDFGQIGARLKLQYRYLDDFAAQLADGLPTNGTFYVRAAMYEQAARSTYHALEASGMRAAGYTEERNVLHPADHCADCLGETARGWAPLGTLTPIGSRRCLTRCRCTKDYR